MGNIIGGKTVNYGIPIGILMLDTRFPRPPGDIGNATTFPFPVAYRIIKGADSHRVVVQADPALIQPFIDSANELVAEGCKAIITSCGFMAIFQKEMAAAVPVPVASSSLIQVGLVSKMLKPDQIVGIITARASSLGEKHFKGVDIENVPKVVYGIEDTRLGSILLGNAVFEDLHYIDMDQAEEEMLGVADRMLADHPNVGAIVLECTNMPPFARAIQGRTGLPVFDVITLIKYMHNAVVSPMYSGHM